MVIKWKLTCDMKISLGIPEIIVDAGVQFVSHDGGKTFRIEGMSALRIFMPEEVSELVQAGILREAS